MTKKRIGVFGCGNMGSALVQAIKNQFTDAEFFLFTPSKIKADELARKVDGKSLNQMGEMPTDLDWYILAFKPQSLDDFEFNFKEDSKILSILAGTPTSKLITKFDSKKIARLMPNIPSILGVGANLLFLNPEFSSIESVEIYSLLNATGKIFSMESEKDLDIATAFSGSGPALIFEFARIFEAELSRMTDGRLPAKEIITQTFLGSSLLMNSDLHNELSFEELRNLVTSKKGVTFEALEVLEKNSIQDIFSRAFQAAYERAIELSK
jgi:pyrroline-5-carboxylate reductase